MKENYANDSRLKSYEKLRDMFIDWCTEHSEELGIEYFDPYGDEGVVIVDYDSNQELGFFMENYSLLSEMRLKFFTKARRANLVFSENGMGDYVIMNPVVSDWMDDMYDRIERSYNGRKRYDAIEESRFKRYRKMTGYLDFI